MVTTAAGLFAGIFLHPALLLLLVFGNVTSVALAMRFGYRTHEPSADETKATVGRAVVPVIHIHPPKMVTEL
ncbi:uncharacterized protein LOC142566268 isoform X2 [Dermacentor variabilis]